jgi:hypothetical protein
VSCLIDYYRFDRAFIRRLLHALFQLGRDLANVNLRHLVTHNKNIRTCIDAQTASRATVFDSDLHKYLPLNLMNILYILSLVGRQLAAGAVIISINKSIKIFFWNFSTPLLY